MKKNWLIWSNEHRAFWAAKRLGYTTNMGEAGRYSRAEAVAIVLGANAGGNLPDSHHNAGEPYEVMVHAPEATTDLFASLGHLSMTLG